MASLAAVPPPLPPDGPDALRVPRLTGRLRHALMPRPRTEWGPHPTFWDGYVVVGFAATGIVLLQFGLLEYLVQTASLESNVSPVLIFATLPLGIALFLVALRACWDARWLAPFYAVSAVVGALALFEDTWHAFGYLAGSPAVTLNAVGWILLGVCTLFGCATFPKWRASPLSLLLLVAFIGGFAVWLSIGYPQLPGGNVEGLALNWTTKVLAFLLFSAILWPPESPARPGPPAPIARAQDD
ncbi:MAG: hypothetical protein L3J80_00105 [Thermoplasmata archaeon]|nr:hypothetical protein [Thermoplasmata archaeon]